MAVDNLKRGGVTRSTADVNAPAQATAAVLTYAAALGRRHVIDSVQYSYDSTPTGGNLKIEDGSGTTVFSVDVPAAGVFVLNLDPPLRGSDNTALILTLASGAGSVKGKLNATHRLE